MIVSLRGTNGAGKSTIVRKIMNLYDVEHQMFEEGRKKPLATMLRKSSRSFAFELLVPGHYEIANGGVDTLPTLDKAYQLIASGADTGAHVLYEGKNMSDSHVRVCALAKKYPVTVVAIRITDADAVKAVRERGHKIKMETIKKLNEKTAREIEIFKKAGIPTFYLPRAKALKKVRELLDA